MCKWLNIIIFANYKYFCNISFSCSLLYEINMIYFNADLSFTPVLLQVIVYAI